MQKASFSVLYTQLYYIRNRIQIRVALGQKRSRSIARCSRKEGQKDTYRKSTLKVYNISVIFSYRIRYCAHQNRNISLDQQISKHEAQAQLQSRSPHKYNYGQSVQKREGHLLHKRKLEATKKSRERVPGPAYSKKIGLAIFQLKKQSCKIFSWVFK